MNKACECEIGDGRNVDLINNANARKITGCGCTIPNYI
jgi:hypothetical protein